MLKHSNIKEDVRELLLRLDFAQEDADVLLSALDKLLDCEVGASELDSLLSMYDESEMCNYTDMMARMKTLAESVGIHNYTAQLLLYLALGEKLRARYRERGIADEIYYNSLLDLRYKTVECKLLHGIVGSLVAPWFTGFYRLTRFALGRLQFELMELKDAFEVGGTHIPEGTRVINIHIPRTGTKLAHELVLDAYRQAAEFFADTLSGSPTVFRCRTWLLDPWNMTVLEPESNLAQFCADFTMVETGHYEGYGEVWRLFDKEYKGDPDAMPSDSSLRRAYIDRIKRGEPIGYGHGMFIYGK